MSGDYYVKGGSRFNEANPKVWLGLFLGGYDAEDYLDLDWKDLDDLGHETTGDPFWRLGGSSGGSKEVEIGLWGDYRIKIDEDGIYGWDGSAFTGIGLPMTAEFTAGETLVNGNLCYLGSSGRMWKADASAEASCDTLLAMCTESISAGNTGRFILFGAYTTSGLTATSEYFVSETAGAITTSRPTTSGSITRHVGTAISTTVLWFDPDRTYIEHL